MAISVRNYRFQRKTKSGMTQSFKCVLVDDSGRKYLHVLMMSENGLTVEKVAKEEERYMREVLQEKKLQTMNTIIRRFAAYGRRVGTTKAAKSFLRKAKQAAQQKETLPC